MRCVGCEQALTRLGFARVWALVGWLGAMRDGLDLVGCLKLALELGPLDEIRRLFLVGIVCALGRSL